jgi:SAM-dependent methyltransferase
MGDLNQHAFIHDHKSLVKGPVLEVGSRDYGNTADIRSQFELDYVGIDISDGKGVDKVINLCDDFEEVDEQLGNKRFGTIICLSVMEHCIDPFSMAKCITRLLADDGILFLSVPFAWKVHGYPSDYWRFTPQGVRALFPELDFDQHPGFATTNVIGRTAPLDDDLMRVFTSPSKGLRSGQQNVFAAAAMSLLRPLRLLPRWLREHPYLSPPVMVNMIGCKQ